MGLTAPYSLRLGMALRQWVERQGAREEGSQRGPSTCLELWVHCLVVCESLACVEGWALPQPLPQTPVRLWPLPISCPSTFPFSSLFSIPESLPTPGSSAPPLLSPDCRARLPLPYQLSPPFLSPVLSLLSLQLPADRVRQVHPDLRAPGPPSTSNQIPPIPRRPPFPSLPGRLFCDLTVATRPQSFPFICDLVCCSGELTHPGVTLVKLVPLCGLAPAQFYKYL